MRSCADAAFASCEVGSGNQPDAAHVRVDHAAAVLGMTVRERRGLEQVRTAKHRRGVARHRHGIRRHSVRPAQLALAEVIEHAGHESNDDDDGENERPKQAANRHFVRSDMMTSDSRFSISDFRFPTFDFRPSTLTYHRSPAAQSLQSFFRGGVRR